MTSSLIDRAKVRHLAQKSKPTVRKLQQYKRLIRILMCWDGEDGERGVVDVRDSREVEGDSVEKEVGVSGSVVDADEALEVLVESLRLGVALPAVEVPQNGGGI